MNDERTSERLEAERAASEASRIGGGSGRPPVDPAKAPVEEAGGGVAEGFEQTEELLVERASHGDSQSAHAILHDRTPSEEDDARVDGEADHERSSEVERSSSI
jgi:hypothetical protein